MGAAERPLSSSTLTRKFAWIFGALPLTCPPKTGPSVMLVTWTLRTGGHMARKRYTPEQVINKLREPVA